MNTNLFSLLRFVAAIIVILYHLRTGSNFLKAAPRMLAAGPQMVTFFFVLAGFSLILGYYRKPIFSQKEYWSMRIARLVPIYMLALALKIALIVMSSEVLSPFALILHLSFMQSWLPPYPLSINGPGWFISDIFFFYATFPLILSYIKIVDPNPIRLLSLALLLWMLTEIILTILLNTSFYRGFPSYSHDLIYYFPPAHYCSFFLGVAAGYLTLKEGSRYFDKIKPNILIFLSLFLVILCIENEELITRAITLGLPFEVSFYAPLFTLLIFSLSSSNCHFTNLSTSRLISFLGEISFSIYILQSPVFTITNYLLKRLYIASYDVRISIHIAILIIIGVFLHYAVEKPIKTAVKNRFYVIPQSF